MLDDVLERNTGKGWRREWTGRKGLVCHGGSQGTEGQVCLVVIKYDAGERLLLCAWLVLAYQHHRPILYKRGRELQLMSQICQSQTQSPAWSKIRNGRQTESHQRRIISLPIRFLQIYGSCTSRSLIKSLPNKDFPHASSDRIQTLSPQRDLTLTSSQSLSLPSVTLLLERAYERLYSLCCP